MGELGLWEIQGLLFLLLVPFAVLVAIFRRLEPRALLAVLALGLLPIAGPISSLVLASRWRSRNARALR